MNEPKPYDIENLSDIKRLIRELRGYMKVSLQDGTDRTGRKYALEALEKWCEKIDENTP